ncbi:hypothetical protein B0H14DRAFT_3882437 [Mycena olivaceomarginata]|nr:hypothetical protein B0H14DRAFT_3882437 [Mycena olivaceomarginata]
MATYFLQYGLQMLNSLRNTSTTVYPCFSLFLGSHRLGILPFSLRAMSESKAHDQGHVVQFLCVRALAPSHGTGTLVAALLPPYWHEAHLDKRQEQSILRRYPVPDHGAVVGQGSGPKRTCTVPPDAWYCRAAHTECPVSAAPRMQAIPVLSSHRGYSPRSFETSYGGSREAGKRRHIARCAHTWREFRSSSKAKPGALPASAHRRSGGQRQRMRAGVDAQEAPALPAKRRGYPTRFPHCDGCVRESGSYPVEAQFQQSDGAWSVCARPRSGVRDFPRSTSCAPAATTPAQTSTWVGPVGPADGVAGPRSAEGYTHPYPLRRVPSDGAFRVSTGSSTQRSGRVREVMTSGWTDRDSGAGGAELAQEEEEFQARRAERQHEREREAETAVAMHAASVVVQDVVSAQPAVIASTSNIENSATITAGPTSTFDTGSFSSATGSVTGGSIAGSPYHMGSPYEFGASSFDAAAQLLKDTTHLALGFDNVILSVRPPDFPVCREQPQLLVTAAREEWVIGLPPKSKKSRANVAFTTTTMLVPKNYREAMKHPEIWMAPTQKEMLWAIAVEDPGWYMAMDVVSAYLNGDMKETVYM